MPVVSVEKKVLYDLMGVAFDTDDEFSDLCFDFGIELDDIYRENDVDFFKIEVPANRYDLLCVEGLSYALGVFLGKRETITFNVVTEHDSKDVIIVDESVGSIRPIIIAAVVENLCLDGSAIKSLIDLQEKLHFNICRQRSLSSIGIHDLDALSFPLTYSAEDKSSVEFVALNETERMTAEKLFRLYEERPKSPLKPYLKLINSFNKIPVLRDATGAVCSLPPIINGALTKISDATKSVLVEVTALDHTRAETVLNTLCFALSHYASQNSTNKKNHYSSARTIKAVHIIKPSATSWAYPDLKSRPIEVDVSTVNRRIGLDLSPSEMASLLTRMQLAVTDITQTIRSDVAKYSLSVMVPPTRSDVIDQCDVAEDVAIAFGYGNITPTIPQAYTVARQFRLNKFADKVRTVVAQSGYVEILTSVLTSLKENFGHMRHAETSAVRLASPKSSELQICRTTLVPGLLKCVAHNFGLTSVPISVFEVGDVVLNLSDGAGEMEVEAAKSEAAGGDGGRVAEKPFELDRGRWRTGAQNRRKLAALYFDASPQCFETINGLLDRVMERLGISSEVERGAAEGGGGAIYFLREAEHGHLFSGRQADVVVRTRDGDKVVGCLGIVHPAVCDSFSENINSNGFILSVVEVDLSDLIDFAGID